MQVVHAVHADSGHAVLEVADYSNGLKISVCCHMIKVLPNLSSYSRRRLARPITMSDMRFILNSSRSSKQGTLINVGKDSEEYKELTETMTMEAGDMEAIGLAEGQRALVRTEFGESEFTCQTGKVPKGMIFIAYGPPTCLLMGGDTGGTGMPTSKGWEVEVVPL